MQSVDCNDVVALSPLIPGRTPVRMLAAFLNHPPLSSSLPEGFLQHPQDIYPARSRARQKQGMLRTQEQPLTSKAKKLVDKYLSFLVLMKVNSEAYSMIPCPFSNGPQRD